SISDECGRAVNRPGRSWWRDAGATEDRARWLGLIPRPVRLALQQPKRHPRGEPASQKAERFAIAEPEPMPPGRPLGALPDLVGARRLDPALRRPGGAPAGRVALTGILLDDQSAADWWDRPRGQGDALVEERPFREREIPLWRRLAIALQLPTYLLLD